MEDMKSVISATLAVFKVEFTIFGFTLSMWDVFLWSIVAGVILGFIGGLFSHD